MWCPDDTVNFTCTVPGSFIVWEITLPGQGADITITLSSVSIDVTQGVFRGVLTDTGTWGMVTATLISLSQASTVNGYMVSCGGESSQESSLTVTVAGELFVCNMTL